jgi:ABC-2 type transport system permease protein
MAILWSRSFIFFLLGPLFPLFVGVMAGSIGAHVEDRSIRPRSG